MAKLRGGGSTATIVAPDKGERMAGRKRVIEPDRTTPEGQCALYLQKLLKDKDHQQIADAIGKQRSTIFNYLSGVSSPSESTKDKIAKAIGLPDYRALTPTDEFLEEIGQLKRRKKRTG